MFDEILIVKRTTGNWRDTGNDLACRTVIKWYVRVLYSWEFKRVSTFRADPLKRLDKSEKKEWFERRTGEQTDRLADERTDERTNGRTNGRTGGRTDGRTDG